VEPGGSAHPLLQDVSLFIGMVDFGADSCTSSLKTCLHVSVRPHMTIIAAPENIRALKVAADAVHSHVVRTHSYTCGISSSILVSRQLHAHHTVNCNCHKQNRGLQMLYAVCRHCCSRRLWNPQPAQFQRGIGRSHTSERMQPLHRVRAIV
jgi:hypothetical protein